MTHHIDKRQFNTQQQKHHVFDVLEHCRKSGLNKAEERKLLMLFGRFATRHEIQMNTRRPPLNVR